MFSRSIKLSFSDLKIISEVIKFSGHHKLKLVLWPNCNKCSVWLHFCYIYKLDYILLLLLFFFLTTLDQFLEEIIPFWKLPWGTCSFIAWCEMILLMNYLHYSHVGSSGPKTLDSIYKLYILIDLNLLSWLPWHFPESYFCPKLHSQSSPASSTLLQTPASCGHPSF